MPVCGDKGHGGGKGAITPIAIKVLNLVFMLYLLRDICLLRVPFFRIISSGLIRNFPGMGELDA